MTLDTLRVVYTYMERLDLIVAEIFPLSFHSVLYPFLVFPD